MRTIKCREGELVTSIKHTGTITGAIRESASITLGKIKDTRGIEPLIETLQDEHWAVRWVAVDALGKIGDKRAFILLHELLATESDNSVNREIIVAMEKLEKKE
jgi:HEAT repeat protein